MRRGGGPGFVRGRSSTIGNPPGRAGRGGGAVAGNACSVSIIAAGGSSRGGGGGGAGLTNRAGSFGGWTVGICWFLSESRLFALEPCLGWTEISCQVFGLSSFVI